MGQKGSSLDGHEGPASRWMPPHRAWLCWMLAAKEDHPWLDSTAMMVVVLHVVPGAQPYSRPFIDSKEITIRQAFRFFVC